MVPSSVFCNTCGAVNRVQAAFCFACGQPLYATTTPQSYPATALITQATRTSTGLLPQNHLLKERYRILAPVGKGGFGAVYKAEDSQFSDRLVAIKEMSQGSLNPQELVEAIEAFQNEVLLLGSLKHHSLPHIYDHFAEVGHWYAVMEFIKGETLEVYLNKEKEKRLPPEEALEIGIQLCNVLGYLHTRKPRIIFRDLKPSNIMRTLGGRLYLIDFGIARHFKPGQARDTTALGSPGYASPEQYGKAQTTPRSDIYSLGVILHQLLTGNDPSASHFQFAPLHAYGHPMPANLEMLIMQMLEMNVDKRPASVEIVKEELRRIADEYTSRKKSIRQPKAMHTSQSAAAPGKPVSPTQAAFIPSAGSISHPQHPAPAKRGISRRTVVLGLAGVIAASLVSGGITWWALTSRFPKSHTTKGPASMQSPQGLQVSTPVYTYKGHSGSVNAVVWSRDGFLVPLRQELRIASASNDGTVQVWDATTGDHPVTYHGHSGAINAVSWSRVSNRQLIASGGDDRTVQVWDADKGSQVFTYKGHSERVNAVTWSPDGSYIASAGRDNTVQVWNAITGSPLYTYKGHSDWVNAVAWSPDAEKRLASASDDKTVQVWIPAASKQSNANFTYKGHSDWVNSVAWSPGGKYIASTGNDATVRIWDPVQGNTIFVYSGHTALVWAVAWSPNGKYIASASKDGTVQVWNPGDGSRILTYRGHSGDVFTIAWSPDGKFIASGGQDQTVQVWKISF